MAVSGSRALANKALEGLGNGVLLTTKVRRIAPLDTVSPAMRLKITLSMHAQLRCSSTSRVQASSRTRELLKQLPSPRPQAKRTLQTSQKPLQEAQTPTKSYRQEIEESENQVDDANGDDGFKRTEKAAQASQLDFSARLSKGNDSNGGGWKEVARLVMIARPELPTLSWAFLCLLISSSVTMSLPLSIGKIMDAASSESDKLFGMEPTHFYLSLGALLATGACANYGRIIILRIVGERIVAKMRSQLFKRTFIQSPEFFDANKTGDLISRLGSDTVIVGKSITQNVSDGLRSFVTAVGGFTLMGYVSLKLTGVLAICFPPVAVAGIGDEASNPPAMTG